MFFQNGHSFYVPVVYQSGSTRTATVHGWSFGWRIRLHANGGWEVERLIPGVGFTIDDGADMPVPVRLALCQALGIEWE